MGMLDGSGLAAVPANEVQTASVRRVGAVGDDAEVADRVAVAQQLALPRPDADRRLSFPSSCTYA